MPDFTLYHETTLPQLLAKGRSNLFDGQRLPSMGISVQGVEHGFRYCVGSDGVRVEPGAAGADFEVELSETDWQGLLRDLESVPGILYGGRLISHRGDLMNFVRWDPLLRALYTGRPIYDAERFTLTAAGGQRLDPAQSFTLDTPATQLQSFLDAAGYLLLKNVFSPEEVQRFRGAALELARGAQEGDQRSWWGRTDGGESVLCRALNAGEHPAYQGLYEDDRIIKLAALLPDGMLHPQPAEQDAVTVVFKNPGVAEGLSDLPWHRDCGMGGHAAMCPNFVFSLYLYDATPEQGCLQFLPGSHRYGCGFLDAGNGEVPGSVTVPACAGDVTVHVGDVMHAAPPPQALAGPYRQSVLLWFHPKFTNHRGERHYNDVLLGADDGQVGHLRDTLA